MTVYATGARDQSSLSCLTVVVCSYIDARFRSEVYSEGRSIGRCAAGGIENYLRTYQTGGSLISPSVSIDNSKVQSIYFSLDRPTSQKSSRFSKNQQTRAGVA